MAKICNNCGRQNDDAAVICAFCRTPFQAAYPGGYDDQRTVVADDNYAAPDFQQPASAPAPAPAPEYAPPAAGYASPAAGYAPAPDYAPTAQENTQSAPTYAQPAPEYTQPAPEYAQPAPTYAQSAPVYQQPAPQVAQPLNVSAPHYATPIQQTPYRPAPEKKNKGLIIGICVAAAVVVVAAVVLIIVLTSGGGGLQGNYVMNSFSQSGMTVNRDTLKANNGGTDVTLTIDSNNTGTLNSTSGSMQMTFDPDKKTVSVDGASATYTLSGKTLTINDPASATVMEFVKQ